MEEVAGKAAALSACWHQAYQAGPLPAVTALTAPDPSPPGLQRGGDPNEGVAYEGATVLEPKVGAHGGLNRLLTVPGGGCWPNMHAWRNACM